MMNSVSLIGRLVREPAMQKTKVGQSVISFTLAVDNRAKKGEEKTTSFIPCIAWNKTAENIVGFVQKGMMMAINGRVNQRTYVTKTNSKINVVEIIVDECTFLPNGLKPNAEGKFESNYEAKSSTVYDIDDSDMPF